MEMEDQYGISDLRQFISRASVGQFPPFPQQQPPSIPSSSDFFSAHHHHRGLSPVAAAPPTVGGAAQQYEMVVMGRSMSDMLHHPNNNNNNNTNNTTSGVGFHQHNNIHNNKDHHHHPHHFNSDSTTTTATANNNCSGFEGGDAGAARWPRQETLTLLEIRSKLDHKFKEANQKGPLWDEVARIMCEEHGYQRTGKKCREKFENLYKYYKKTKEGKAGRQDGKHYRFFRQLEALYGDHPSNNNNSDNAGNVPPFDTTNTANIIQSKGGVTTTDGGYPSLRPTSVSLSNNSSDYDTSSSDNEVIGGSIESEDSRRKKRGKRSNWKSKIKDFIDYQMRKIMEKQEAWLEKMMKTMDNREREREELWRKQEVERMEREHKFWASERAWIEARDSALINTLERLTDNTREKKVVIGLDDSNRHKNIHSSSSSPCRIGTTTATATATTTTNPWLEMEVTRLIQLRTSMESRFQQCGFSEEVLWEDIAAKMAYLGYDRSAIVCKHKWDCLNKFFQEKDNNNEGSKKRKENYGEVSKNINNNNNNITPAHNNIIINNSNHHHNEGGLCMNYMGGFISNTNNCETRLQLNEGSSSPSSHNSNANANANVNVSVNNTSNVVGVTSGGMNTDSCLRFFLGDGEGCLGWETNYGMKLNKGA